MTHFAPTPPIRPSEDIVQTILPQGFTAVRNGVEIFATTRCGLRDKLKLIDLAAHNAAGLRGKGEER